MKQEGIIRTSFGLGDEIKPKLEESYNSPLIQKIKEEGYSLSEGRLTLFLAEEFGFCYGVDRAIDYAYQTRAKFPKKRIFLTNEIIHNPRVNTELKEMGVIFLEGERLGEPELDQVSADDVVLMPAFGTTAALQDELEKKGCIIVDTTCGSVMSVWKRVEAYSRDGFTSLIHGKYNHEETLATSSRALKYPNSRYLIVRDKEQVEKVCRYIEEGGDKNEFYEEFKNSYSPDFDPDKDLEKIGCANQTTMLSSESLEIANMVKDSIEKRYGASELPGRFRHFDTICSATQDRQDAILKLAREKMDVMIVVGGYNSSNTGHLAEISSEYCPAFHVKDADCLISKEVIEHKVIFKDETTKTNNWLPSGPIKLGVTAGASTPNRVIEEVIEKLIKLTGES